MLVSKPFLIFAWEVALFFVTAILESLWRCRYILGLQICGFLGFAYMADLRAVIFYNRGGISTPAIEMVDLCALGDCIQIPKNCENQFWNHKDEYLTENDIFWLAQTIYHEARSESYWGQVAAAYTVINRCKDYYGFCRGGVKKVVFEVVNGSRAYSFTEAIGKVRSKPQWDNAVKVARMVGKGELPDPSLGAKFYYNPQKVSSVFHENLTSKGYTGFKVTENDQHKFQTNKCSF